MNNKRTSTFGYRSKLLALFLTSSLALTSVSSSIAAPPPPEDAVFETITLPPEAQSAPDGLTVQSRASGNPKLDSTMAGLAIAARTSTRKAIELARSRSLKLSGNRVHVQVVTHAPGLENAIKAMTEAGGEVTGVGNDGTLIQGWLPVDALETVAAQDDVYFIRRPAEVQLFENLYAGNSTTEGLTVINGPAWHTAGYTGSGVKVAIIDGGFIGYADLLGVDLPASVTVENFVDGEDDSQVDGTTEHGTACAEVIHDIVPDATLYLAKVSTNLDLAEAVAWAKDTHQVDIISTSVGWYNLTPGDGTGEFANLVQDARNAGILWATAASNDREAHWGGLYSDPDADDAHNFDGTQEINYFGPGDGDAYNIPSDYLITAFLRWDDWTAVDQDYDMYLLRWNGSSWDTIAAGEDVQDGSPGQTPTEFAYAVTSGASTAYGFVILRHSGTRSVNLEAFLPKVAPLDELLHARSLSNLADAPDAMTVAALDVTSPYPQESYSSEGPTNGPGGAETGGFTKPDISGFANVATESYSGSTFNGTSAATPHVAGAAALVLSAYPSYTPDQLQSFLEGHAIDMGSAGMDTLYGYGRLYLGAPPAGANTAPTISGLPNQSLPANTSRDNAIELWDYATDTEDADADLTFSIVNSPDSDAGVSIDPDGHHIDINPAAGWTGATDVEIQVQDTGGLTDSDTFRVTVSPAADKTWDGSVSGDWHTAGNWTPSGVPDSGDDVLIPDVTNDPVISTGDAEVDNLTIDAGAVVNLTERALTVEGTLTNNGTLKQTQDVGPGSSTEFLRITNLAGNQTKYYGVDITPSSALDVIAGPAAMGDGIDADGDAIASMPNVDVQRTIVAPKTFPEATTTILMDYSHGVLFDNDPTTDYTNLTALLEAQGHTVVVSNQGILNLTLDDYGVIVLNSMWSGTSSYSTDEVSALQDFVDMGGGLFLIGEASGCGGCPAANSNLNQVATALAGITLGDSTISPTNLYFTNFQPHDIFSGVSQLYYRYAGALDVVLPGVELAYTDSSSDVTVAGYGKIIAVGDSFMSDGSYWGIADDVLFLENIFDWLSRTGMTNTLPTLSDLPDQTVPMSGSAENAIDLWTYANDAEDTDADLTFTIFNSPDLNAGVSIDSNRYIDINPVAGWVGQTDVEVQVQDTGGLTDTDTFRVMVSSSPDIEVSPPLFDEWVHIDEVLTQTLTIGNTGTDSLTFSISEVPRSFASLVSVDSHQLAQSLDETGNLPQELRISRMVPLSLGDVVSSFSAPVNGFLGLEWVDGYLWAASSSNDTLYRLDPTNGTILETLPVPGLHTVGLAWDGTAFWVSDSSADTIAKVDTSGTVLLTFPAPSSGPVGLAWDGTYLWDVDFAAYALHQIDPGTGAVLRTIPAPDARPAGVAWDGQYLWTNGRDSATTYQVDPADGSVLAFFSTSPGPSINNGQGAAFDGQYVWIANRDAATLYQIDIEHITPDVPWLSEDPISGTVPVSDSLAVDVVLDAAGLVTGDYTADLAITNNDPDENAVTVPITMHVTDNMPPTISGIPDQVVIPGSAYIPLDLWPYASDAESPVDVLTYTIDNAPDPNAGVSIDSNRYVDIVPTPGWTGQATVVIRVTDPGDLFDTDAFSVTVGQFPDIEVVPTTFVETVPPDGTLTRTLTISNTGADDLIFVIDDGGVSWLSQSPISGIVLAGGSQPVDIVFDATGLTTGDYAATLTISNNDPDEDPVTVSVVMHVEVVGDFPDIEVVPTTLDETVPRDRTLTHTLTISNTGTDYLMFVINDGGVDWLSENPASGMVLAGEAVAVDTVFDATGMTTGDYATNLTISSNDPDEGVVTVTVTMHVIVTGDLISVTVSVSGNQFCSGRTTGAKRCFDIDPASPMNTTARFYLSEGERNGQTLDDLLVFHYDGDWMEEPGPYIRGGTGDAQYVEAQNVDDFSPFALDTSGPTGVYLPLIMRRWPPIPDPPVLNAINNTDRDGNYTVSWNAAFLADTYTLQEDDTPSFSTPVTAYGPGTATSTSITGRPVGTYYYRVKATNFYGDSGWSNVQSVSVMPPSKIYASADTTIIQGYPTLNLCDTSDMWAGYDDMLDPDGKIVRSLIKFDVSGIPAGTAISQVTLNVRFYGYYDFPNRSRTITTYRVGSDWSSCSTTWNNRPTIAEAYGSRSVAQDLGSWYAFDVTNLVRGWINGNFANYGVWLRGPEASGSDSSWRSFYTQNTTSDPYLSITYSGLSEAEQRVIFERETDALAPTSRIIEKLDSSFPADSCQSSSVNDQKCLNALP